MPQIKPIYLIIFFAFIVIAYIGWKQQNQSLKRLKSLKSAGVNIDSFIYSRPLLAVNGETKKVILIHPNHTTDLRFREIDNIRFIETRYSSQESGNPMGPDKIRITLKNRETIEIRDLQKTAKETLDQLQPFLNGIRLDFQARP